MEAIQVNLGDLKVVINQMIKHLSFLYLKKLNMFNFKTKKKQCLMIQVIYVFSVEDVIYSLLIIAMLTIQAIVIQVIHMKSKI